MRRITLGRSRLVGQIIPLTAVEQSQIVGLYQDGVLIREIIRSSGRSRYTVYGVLKKSGLRATRNQPAENRRHPCEVCGKPTRYIAPVLRAQGLGRFCSAACMGQAKRLPPSQRVGMATELECGRCKKTRPVGDFYSHKATARGYQYCCKDCCREVRKERAKVPQDPRVTRKHKLRDYGITQADYDAMYEQQGGRCAICRGVKEPWEPAGGAGRQRFLVVDHDHKTGRVRALLCWNCNCGIGHFREDRSIILAAAAYVGLSDAGVGPHSGAAGQAPGDLGAAASSSAETDSPRASSASDVARRLTVAESRRMARVSSSRSRSSVASRTAEGRPWTVTVTRS